MIVCWSVKGGSGTTVVSAALAFALSSKHSCNVRIIDMAGDMPAAIGMAQPTGPGIAEWLAAEEEVTIRPLVVDVLRDGYMITATVVAPRTIRWWLIGTTSTLFSLRASVTMHVQEVG